MIWMRSRLNKVYIIVPTSRVIRTSCCLQTATETAFEQDATKKEKSNG